jgi:hypothetical protein
VLREVTQQLGEFPSPCGVLGVKHESFVQEAGDGFDSVSVPLRGVRRETKACLNVGLSLVFSFRPLAGC